MKQFKAKLRKPIEARCNFDVDYNNILEASSMVSELKHRTFLEIKQIMHEKIDTLHIDDLDFEVIDNK